MDGIVEEVVAGEAAREPPRLVLPLVAEHEVDVPERECRERGLGLGLDQLAAEPWVTGKAGLAWDEMTRRTCREQGGFEPDVRHRTDDATVALALVARGLAVTMLPELTLPPDAPRFPLGVARTIFAVTRTTDAARPSTRALLAAVTP
jgi:DNA-binding transcriptional LysR family regulator